MTLSPLLRSRGCLFFVCFLFTCEISLASQSKLSGTVQFFAEATPGFLEIEGSGGRFSGKLQIDGQNRASGEFVCDLKAFTTGIDLRDQHMKERYLEVSKFPTARLTVAKVKLPGDGDTASFDGKLTLHGVTKPITGSIEHDEKNYVVRFKVKTSEFGIPQASYKLVKVGETVDVKVAFKY